MTNSAYRIDVRIRAQNIWEDKMKTRMVGPLAAPLLALFITIGAATAGPAEDANAALDRFSASYTANDVDALVQLYSPNTILLGTNSPNISEGRDAVRAYFTNLKLAGSGNRNQIQERKTIVINDNAVLITGFYEFTRISEGKPVPGPARFTVLLTKSGGQWLIAHQHSSPRAQPKTN
jgi:uncharacterized protein (TIGR02246 family)